MADKLLNYYYKLEVVSLRYKIPVLTATKVCRAIQSPVVI